MISKYGYDVVGVVSGICLLTLAATWFLSDGRILKWVLTSLILVLLAFTLYFFRDPERTSPSGKGFVLSPADGTVLSVGPVQENEFLRAEAMQISIFMSPLNVHVNRFPISGTIGFFRHIPGEYLMAYEEKSSTRNERTLIGIEGKEGKVLFKQIAGFIARRIVADVHEGETARAGERFGMIKFGSRVDVILPRSAAIRVVAGEKTVAGETVLAIVAQEGPE